MLKLIRLLRYLNKNPGDIKKESVHQSHNDLNKYLATIKSRNCRCNSSKPLRTPMWVNKRQIDEQDRNTLVYSDGYMFKNIFVLASITFKCTSCNTSQVFDI